MVISVVQTDEQYTLTDNGDLVCTHVDAYVEKACCPPSMDIVECGCGGQDSIICPNPECTCLTDSDTGLIGDSYYD